MHKNNAHIIKRIFACGACTFFVLLMHIRVLAQDNTHNQTADSFDINKASFRLPQPLPKWRYYHALSIIHVIVPKDWTLDFINAPMFSYEAKYTLPKGFNIQGSLSTLFISTRINLGPFWNFRKENYSFGVGYQVAFNYGILNQLGFKTRMVVWEQQPSIAVGRSFKHNALTLRGDLYWTNAIYQYQGGHVVPLTNSFINGYSVGASFEQRLWKKKIMFFGLRMNYLRYHIIAWPAFPVNQYRYWVPEIPIGIVF